MRLRAGNDGSNGEVGKFDVVEFVAKFILIEQGHSHRQRHYRTANPQGLAPAHFIAMVEPPSIWRKAVGFLHCGVFSDLNIFAIGNS